MTTNKKKLLLPNTMAKAGWDVLIGRDDIEAVGYDPYITMPDLQVALKDTDGIALSLTPLKAPEIAAAPSPDMRTHEPEQEESDATADHGESRLGCADRP